MQFYGGVSEIMAVVQKKILNIQRWLIVEILPHSGDSIVKQCKFDVHVYYSYTVVYYSYFNLHVCVISTAEMHIYMY